MNEDFVLVWAIEGKGLGFNGCQTLAYGFMQAFDGFLQIIDDDWDLHRKWIAAKISKDHH